MRRLLNAFDKTSDLLTAAEAVGDKELTAMAKRARSSIEGAVDAYEELHEILCRVRKDT